MRATATVLFTDLVGSTDLRVRLGEEAAEELRRLHDRLLAQAVESNDGKVVKGLGDGVMATFAGAADAVAAAIAVQQAVDRLNRTGKSALPLAVRVGLSAGDVTFEDADVHGTPVIEAARLCAAAGGGEILASELVRGLVGGAGGASFVPVGALELKGLAEPMLAVRVSWEPVLGSRLPMPPLLSDVGRIFVGREAQLERLRQLWKEAAAGDRRVVFVAGEPGVGKTRLAAELALRVHDEGATVLAGRCDEDMGVPYQPVVEALRHYVDHTPADQLAERLGRYGGELSRLIPELTDAVPQLPAPLKSDPETERYRLFDAVAAWLAAASGDEPLLLVLDDLQWAAKPTLLLLRHVVRAAGGRRVLVVATYRDTELSHDHPLVEVLADARRYGGVERVSLTGLDSPGVAAFMEQAAGHALAGDDVPLAQAIYEETEGNPFFVREVLQHLAETGAVEKRGGRWGARLHIEELGIPEGVREVVGRRLSRLSAQANEVLRLAAVFGAEFEVSVVQRAGRLDDETLLSSLEQAANARLVVETGGGRYRFAHALVRDALYEQISTPRRLTLHRHMAEALEVVHANRLDDYLPALAHHYARASAPAAMTAKAVTYAARAGDRALEQLAHDEAVAYYRQALEFLAAGEGPVDEGQRVDLLIALGEAQRRAGDPAYRETLLEAARLAMERSDADALARAAVANSRGYFSVAGRVDTERVETLEAALEMAGPADSPLRARLLAQLAVELTWAPHTQRRRELVAEALVIARRTGNRATLGHVLAMRYTPSLPADLHEDLAELAAVATELDDPALAFFAANWAAQNALVTADRAGFDDQVARSALLAEELGQPWIRWVVAMVRSVQARIAGELDRSENYAGQARELGEPAGIPDAFRVYGVQLLWIRYDQGRLDDVVDLLTRAAARNDPQPLTLAALALTLAELDRMPEARQALGALAADGFATLPTNYAWLYGLTMAAEACAHIGDVEAATVLYERLEPYCGFVGTVWSGATGFVDHYLGLLAATLGRLDEADARFAAAAVLAERMGAPVWLARTRLERARALLTRRRPGDPERARDLLGQASTTARTLGLAGIDRQAGALQQAGSKP